MSNFLDIREVKQVIDEKFKALELAVQIYEERVGSFTSKDQTPPHPDIAVNHLVGQIAAQPRMSSPQELVEEALKGYFHRTIPLCEDAIKAAMQKMSGATKLVL